MAPSSHSNIQTVDSGITSVLEINGYTTGPVTIVDRESNPWSASYTSEIVTCRLDGGRRLQLFCKHGHNDIHGCANPHGGIAYEAAVYRQVLVPSDAASLKFYGDFVDRATEETWIVLEYLDGCLHADKASAQEEALGLAAHWIGRFHATNEERLTNALQAPLRIYNAAYYHGWTRRAASLPAEVHEEYPWLTAVCRGYGELVDGLLRQPVTMIHGDYYADNALYRDGIIYPVDWGLAALGVAEIDLACLVNDWPIDTVQKVQAEYRQARWPERAPDDFDRIFQIAQFLLSLRLLWENLDWTSEKSVRWRFHQLRTASERLQLL